MSWHLFNPGKLEYVRGGKPDVPCILCAVADKNPAVADLEIGRTGRFCIALNLFPFNNGHLLIFPLRHVENPADLNDEEALELHRLTVLALGILGEHFNPAGFNLGCNIGKAGGASIGHLHVHLVPRYENELGFLDVVSGTRVMVGDPFGFREELRGAFSKVLDAFSGE